MNCPFVNILHFQASVEFPKNENCLYLRWKSDTHNPLTSQSSWEKSWNFWGWKTFLRSFLSIHLQGCWILILSFKGPAQPSLSLSLESNLIHENFHIHFVHSIVLLISSTLSHSKNILRHSQEKTFLAHTIRPFREWWWC